MNGTTLTYLDAALLAVCFISGLLAMYRGFARELLSILSWIAAAGVGAWIFLTKKELSADVAAQTGLPPQIALAVVALVAALIVLIIVHLITARVSDAILDSRVGMIDRVLGFLFGVARGFILIVIPYMGYEAFVTADRQNQNPIVRDAYFHDSLKSTGDWIRGILLTYLDTDKLQGPGSNPATPPPGGQQGLLNGERRFVALAFNGKIYYMTVAHKA